MEGDRSGQLLETFVKQDRQAIERMVAAGDLVRHSIWTESMAVGSRDFIHKRERWFGKSVAAHPGRSGCRSLDCSNLLDCCRLVRAW